MSSNDIIIDTMMQWNIWYSLLCDKFQVCLDTDEFYSIWREQHIKAKVSDQSLMCIVARLQNWKLKNIKH